VLQRIQGSKDGLLTSDKGRLPMRPGSQKQRRPCRLFSRKPFQINKLKRFKEDIRRRHSENDRVSLLHACFCKLCSASLFLQACSASLFCKKKPKRCEIKNSFIFKIGTVIVRKTMCKRPGAYSGDLVSVGIRNKESTFPAYGFCSLK